MPYNQKEIRDIYNQKKSKKAAPVLQGPTVTDSPQRDLNDEYDRKARRMDARLSQQAAKHSIVPGGVKMKIKRPKDIYAKEEEKGEDPEPLDLDLIPDRD